MRYLTHQFAHPETLERARRWLVHAGFDPSQIEAVADGIPRIAIRVSPGESSAAERIIDVAELADPDGLPSFWELARQPHVHTQAALDPAEAGSRSMESRTFVVGYHIPDDRPDQIVDAAALAMRDAYLDREGS